MGGKEDQKQDKSKSLPPASGIDSQNGKKSGKLSKEEKAAMEAEEKFKKLPTPEREKILQRRKKFEGNMPVKPVAKKISLKRAAADPDDNLDDNDTEEKSEKEKSMPPAKNRRQANKASNEPQAKVVTDLRVHLHKKSRLQQNTTAVPVRTNHKPKLLRICEYICIKRVGYSKIQQQFRFVRTTSQSCYGFASTSA